MHADAPEILVDHANGSRGERTTEPLAADGRDLPRRHVLIERGGQSRRYLDGS